MPAPEKDAVDTALANLKKALEGTDIAAVRTATDELAAESQKMGSAIYANAQANSSAAVTRADGESGPTSGATDGASDGADEVIDAEIVDEGTS